MNQTIIIRPKKKLLELNLPELWRYRELLYIFVWRDIKVRYKQTILGIIWVVFQPLVTTGIFTVFFGKIAKIPSDNIPYPLFVFAGLTMWNFFSSGWSNSANSLVASEALIKKIYFPRLIIPLAAILTCGVDFLVTLVLLLVTIFIFRYVPNILSVVVFPLMILILLLTVSGLGLFTAALNVKYRDIRYILPFFVQTGLFVSPVVYPLSAIYDYRKFILMLNPMTGVIETTRALITSAPLNWELILISLVISILTFLFGIYYFRRAEGYFADLA